MMFDEDIFIDIFKTLYEGTDTIKVADKKDDKVICILDITYSDFGRWISVAKHNIQETHDMKFVIHTFKRSIIEKLLLGVMFDIDEEDLYELTYAADEELRTREYRAIKSYMKTYYCDDDEE